MTGEKVATVRAERTYGCSTTRLEFRKDPDGSGFEWRTNDVMMSSGAGDSVMRFKVGDETKEFFGYNPGDGKWRTCFYTKHIKEGSMMQIEYYTGQEGCYFSLSGATKALNQL